MNRVQYRRWKDFARRMAARGWSARQIMRKTHQEAVIPAVDHFFELLEWDNRDDIIRIESWDNTRADYTQKDPWGHPPIGPYVCDLVSELLQNYNPFYHEDETYDKAYENWDELWGGRIRCCLRAGLDLASSESAGVMGFRKEDIERMYPEGVPKWIQQGWGRRNETWHPIDWDEILSTAGLWTGGL